MSDTGPGPRDYAGLPALDGGRVIHIHEDDYGLRALHPLAARAEVRTDLAAAVKSGIEHEAPGGGWTQMHVITPPRATFAGTGLALEALKAALAAHLPRVSRFVMTAGGGFTPGSHDSYGVYDDAPVCYGFDEEAYVIVETGGAGGHGAVQAIHFERSTENPASLTALAAALRAVDALTPCLLADYAWDVEGAVADAAWFEGYWRMG